MQHHKGIHLYRLNQYYLLTPVDHCEIALNAAIIRNTFNLTCLSWDDISAATSSDPVLSLLLYRIRDGIPAESKLLEESLHPFWNIRDALCIADEDVVMYFDRVVVPSSLRPKALNISISLMVGIFVYVNAQITKLSSF